MSVRVVPSGVQDPDRRREWSELQARALAGYGWDRRGPLDQTDAGGLWLRLAAESGGRLVGALALRVEGDRASFAPFFPLIDPDAPFDEAASSLWEEARAKLAEWGVTEVTAALRLAPGRRAPVEPLLGWYDRAGLAVSGRLVMTRPLDYPDVAAIRRREPSGFTFATWVGRDAEALARLFDETFAAAEGRGEAGESPAEHRQWIRDTQAGRRGAYDSGRAFLAMDGDRPVGSAVVTLYPDEALLAHLGVLPGYRRRGLGLALLGRAYEAALRSGRRRLSVVVGEDNGPARALCAAAGFAPVAEVYLARGTPGGPVGSPLAVVTGGTGYVGRALVRHLLRRGWRVRCLVRDPASERAQQLTAGGAELRAGDVLDPAGLGGLFDGATDAYHLVGTAAGDPAEMWRLNVDGAVNVAREALDKGLAAFTVASSATVYGDAGEGLIDEAAPLRADTAYGRSKVAMEEALRALGGGGSQGGDARTDALNPRTGGLPLKIARIGAVYGPDSPMLPVGEIGKGRFRLIGTGENWGSYIHVDDLAPALFWLSRRGTTGEAYNLCDDRPVKVGRFYGLAAETLGAPHLEYVSPGAARMMFSVIGAAGRLGGRSPAVPPDLVRMMTTSLRMSNARLRNELGAVLTCPSVDEGLARTLAEGGPDHALRS